MLWMLLAGCWGRVGVQTEALEPASPTLLEADGAWWVTGIKGNLPALERGELLVVYAAVTGTADTRMVATLRVVDPPGPGAATAKVAPWCVEPGRSLAAGMEVGGFDPRRRSGRCLARVLSQGDGHVVLDVGRADGVRAYDDFRLLGAPVSVGGWVPVPVGSEGDGICQVPEDTHTLQDLTTHCALGRLPAGERGAPTYAVLERAAAP